MDQINRIRLGGQRVTQVHWKPFSLRNKTKKVKDYSRDKEGYVTIYKKTFYWGSGGGHCEGKWVEESKCSPTEPWNNCNVIILSRA